MTRVRQTPYRYCPSRPLARLWPLVREGSSEMRASSGVSALLIQQRSPRNTLQPRLQAPLYDYPPKVPSEAQSIKGCLATLTLSPYCLACCPSSARCPDQRRPKLRLPINPSLLFQTLPHPRSSACIRAHLYPSNSTRSLLLLDCSQRSNPCLDHKASHFWILTSSHSLLQIPQLARINESIKALPL